MLFAILALPLHAARKGEGKHRKPVFPETVDDVFAWFLDGEMGVYAKQKARVRAVLVLRSFNW
jgi:hypothetical protein